MKNEKIKLEKRIALSKETIVRLNGLQLEKIKGGGVPPKPTGSQTCGPSSFSAESQGGSSGGTMGCGPSITC
jgi:hypothetical protein